MKSFVPLLIWILSAVSAAACNIPVFRYALERWLRGREEFLALQAATGAAQDACPAAVDRCLDFDAVRWETDYFRARFLVGHWGLAGHLTVAESIVDLLAAEEIIDPAE